MPSSPPNNKPCILLWEFRFILLLFLHINSELNSCFSASAISHLWYVSFLLLCYFTTLQSLTDISITLKHPSHPLHYSCLHISREPRQTHSSLSLLLPLSAQAASAFKQLCVCVWFWAFCCKLEKGLMPGFGQSWGTPREVGRSKHGVRSKLHRHLHEQMN